MKSGLGVNLYIYIVICLRTVCRVIICVVDYMYVYEPLQVPVTVGAQGSSQHQTVSLAADRERCCLRKHGTHACTRVPAAPGRSACLCRSILSHDLVAHQQAFIHEHEHDKAYAYGSRWDTGMPILVTVCTHICRCVSRCLNLVVAMHAYVCAYMCLHVYLFVYARMYARKRTDRFRATARACDEDVDDDDDDDDDSDDWCDGTKETPSLP